MHLRLYHESSEKIPLWDGCILPLLNFLFNSFGAPSLESWSFLACDYASHELPKMKPGETKREDETLEVKFREGGRGSVCFHAG